MGFGSNDRRWPAKGSYVGWTAAGRLSLIALGVAAPALTASGVLAQGLFTGGAGFTAAEVEQGKAAYARSCVSCHGADLVGGQFGPPLKGEAFQAHWRGQTRAALSNLILTTMPPGATGTLSSGTYAAIEAYILQANGVAASSQAIAAQQKAPEPVSPGAMAANPEQQAPPRGAQDAAYKAEIARRMAKLAAVTSVTDAMLKKPSEADWLIWRRTYEGLGHSPLKQINKANVGQLQMAWSWSLPISQNEITPLVHDGVMFLASGPAVQALDAVTGELLWQYLRRLPDEFDNGRTFRVKTLAIYGDKVFAPTVDGHLVALDVKTGKVVWDREVITDAEAKTNGQPEGVALHLHGGPVVAKGQVIIGASLGLNNAKGGAFIVGVDAQTGKETWRFHTIARPGQPGGDSWNGAPVEERFGGGVWTAGSYDPDLDLIYFGIGNTYNSATLLEPRPGASGVTNNDGLYTDTTVALRPATGELAWHFQHQKRDVWDLDWVFEQSLITLPVDGRPRKLVVTGGKTAIFDAVDAATGRFVFSTDLGLQNQVIAVDPKTGEKTVNPAVQPQAGVAKFLCPTAFGARNWPATAINPSTGIMYIPLIEACTDYTYAPRTAAETAAGGSDMKFSNRTRPDSDGKFGRLAALDLKTRKVVWTHRQRMPLASSALTTDGGLLFNGDLDRHFSAYDQATGKVLWRTRLSASPDSSPVTYSVGGRQYVAVVAGGGSAFSAGGRGLVPEVGSPAAGTTVVVFELPKAAR